MSQLLRDKAIQTALLGDWKTAVNINKELLKVDPKDIDALNRLAMALLVMGKKTSAKTTYQKVLKIDPLNPIALRNLKQLKITKGKAQDFTDLQLNNKFLEESGKTKVVELVNTAQPGVLQSLITGEGVNLAIKRSRIFVLKGEKSREAGSRSAGQYIGVLPDDIGRRLIKFIKSGNKYEAYIKSANSRKVVVFIKELKRSNRYKNQPSFLALSDNLLFNKKDGLRIRRETSDLDEEASEEEMEEEV